MRSNYTLDKLTHKTRGIKVTEYNSAALAKFQRVAYVIMAINVAAAVAAIAIIMFLTGLIK